MDELVLSPKELFFLAKTCDGSYLNYDYIEMLPDIQQQMAIYEDNCAESLSGKGLVEDVWGEVAVKPETKRFLEPIWDGEYEAIASLVTLREQCSAAIVYVYGLGGRHLMVCRQEDGLHIWEVTEDQLVQLAVSLMPKGYEQRLFTEDPVQPTEEPTEMVVLKSVITETSSASIEQFYLSDGLLLRKTEAAEPQYRIVTADMFVSIALSVLKGE